METVLRRPAVPLTTVDSAIITGRGRKQIKGMWDRVEKDNLDFGGTPLPRFPVCSAVKSHVLILQK